MNDKTQFIKIILMSFLAFFLSCTDTGAMEDEEVSSLLTKSRPVFDSNSEGSALNDRTDSPKEGRRKRRGSITEQIKKFTGQNSKDESTEKVDKSSIQDHSSNHGLTITISETPTSSEKENKGRKDEESKDYLNRLVTSPGRALRRLSNSEKPDKEKLPKDKKNGSKNKPSDKSQEGSTEGKKEEQYREELSRMNAELSDLQDESKHDKRKGGGSNPSSSRERLKSLISSNSTKQKKGKEEKKKEENSNAEEEYKPALNFDLNLLSDVALSSSLVPLSSNDSNFPKESNNLRGFNVLSRKNSSKIINRHNLTARQMSQMFPQNSAKTRSESIEKASEELDNFVEELFNKDEELRDSICGIPLNGTFCGYPVNKICVMTTIGACTLLGLAPSSPMSGLLLWSVGDAFKVSVGGIVSGCLIGFTMITTTPAFLRQFYEKGQHISEGIFIEDETKWLNEYTHQKSWQEYSLNVITFLTASIEASVYLGTMILAEKNFPIFTGITGGPFFLSWLERYYDIGTRNTHNLLVKYFYDTKDTQRKRTILLERLKESEKRTDSIEAGSIGNKELMDAFFKNDEEADDEDIDSTPVEKFMDHISVLMTGWAATGRLSGSQYIIERIFAEYFSVNPDAASQIAWGFALYELIFKTATEFQTQKESFRSVLNIFSTSHCPDWSWARKISGAVTLVSGGLLAFTRTVPALSNLNRWSSSLPDVMKYLAVAPSFIVDLGYYQAFLDEKFQGLITSLVMSLPERYTIEASTEWILHHSEMTYVQKWRQCITKGVETLWNGETISMLYEAYGTKLETIRNHNNSNGYQTI